MSLLSHGDLEETRLGDWIEIWLVQTKSWKTAENGRRLSRDHVLEEAHQVDSVKTAEMLSYNILLQ